MGVGLAKECCALPDCTFQRTALTQFRYEVGTVMRKFNPHRHPALHCRNVQPIYRAQ